MDSKKKQKVRNNLGIYPILFRTDVLGPKATDAKSTHNAENRKTLNKNPLIPPKNTFFVSQLALLDTIH